MKITLNEALEVCSKMFDKKAEDCCSAVYRSDMAIQSYLKEKKVRPELHPVDFKRDEEHWEFMFNMQESLEEQEGDLVWTFNLDDDDYLIVYGEDDACTFKSEIKT